MKGSGPWIIIAIFGVFVLAYALASGSINAIVPGMGTDLGYMFEHLLSETNPEFMTGAESTCESAGGTWISAPNKFGCFNMPPGTFDTTDCNDLGYRLTSEICKSVKANVICEDTDVGCSY